MAKTKLTIEQAMEIRRRFENVGPGGSGAASLAVQFGVGKDTVYRILSGTHPLVRGVPDISGVRRGTLEGPVLEVSNEVSDRQRMLVERPSRKTQHDHRQNLCPVCGATRNEYCVDMRAGSIQRELRNVHPERRK